MWIRNNHMGLWFVKIVWQKRLINTFAHFKLFTSVVDTNSFYIRPDISYSSVWKEENKCLF